jgi:ribokinase
MHAPAKALTRRGVVSVGLMAPSLVVRVAQHPTDNGHAEYRNAQLQIGADAAIVAATLAQWRITTTILGNALGRDALGRDFARVLRSYGLRGQVRLSRDLVTPLEFIAADARDVRVWYTPECTDVWKTIETADFRVVAASLFLYTDWYAEEGAAAASRAAAAHAVPLLLNLGRSAWRRERFPAFAEHASILQVSCDEGAAAGSAEDMLADLCARTKAPTIVVTHGRHGCVASVQRRVYRVPAPKVDVVDTNGAGAAFSAALIYAQLQAWEPLEQLRFACAAGALKCGAPGIIQHSPASVQTAMRHVRVAGRDVGCMPTRTRTVKR